LLLPARALSGSYRVTAWPSWYTEPGYFAVVGLEDGTDVTVAPSATILSGGGLSSSGGTVTLDRGDVLQVMAPVPGVGPIAYGADLSGSLVTTIDPTRHVAVFGGHNETWIPVDTAFADHLEEQIPPLESSGSEFVVAVPGGRATHWVKLVGTVDATALSYAPSAPAGAPSAINAGQSIVFQASADFRMLASSPVLVSQYLEGGQGVSGDPAMAMVAPTTQFVSHYDFAAPTTFTANWVTIVAPSGQPVSLDGAAVPPASFAAVGGTSFAVARVALSATSTAHHLSAAVPIGAFVAGYVSSAAYLYPAGMGLQGVPPDPAAIAPWSSASTGGGNLQASAGAAMDGSASGLAAAVNDTTGLYVQDDTPVDENRYRARFWFDPHDFDTGEAQGHRRTRIFVAFEEAPTRRLAAVVLRRVGGAYAVEARTRLDDNSQADTPFFPISDGPHAIEIDWKRASGPDALDGSLELWIDGTSMATLGALDNSRSAVDFVRLGALSVKSGASGTLYWDEFESRRATYIGP